MKARHRRLLWVLLALALVAAAAGLILRAFRSNLVFFFTPSQVYAHQAPIGHDFRLGGLVKKGSLHRVDLQAQFVVTDTFREVPVSYTGILPDLFKEGKGVVAQGHLGNDGAFVATQVLAKHDENYMPPEAADALKKAAQLNQGVSTSTLETKP